MTLTAKEMNTELAQKISDIFERSKRRRYEAFAAAEKLKKKSASSADAGEHVDPSEMPKGVLAKDSQYAQRGSDHIRAQDGRGVYRNFDFPHLDSIRELVRARAEFPGGPVANFTPNAKTASGGKAGQQYPYEWEAHHILPGSAFYYETASGPCFSWKQLWLLLQTDYNINHGHNIIMLPTLDWAPPVHSLLQHPSDHPEYTQKVMGDLKTIAEQIQKKIDEAQPHEGIKLDLFSKLQSQEDKYWKYIVGLSRAVVAAVTSGQEFQVPNVRFSTKGKDPTNYPFGALY